MSNTLEERLKTHSSAFDGLLSLIPAKYYYDNATQDQWQQKKKSKKETQQNKRAKLDPSSIAEADDYTNSHASAKDVMVNKAATAKKVVLPSKVNFSKPVQDSTSSNDEESDQNDGVEVASKILQSEDEAESDTDLINNSALLVFDDDGNEVESVKEEKKVEPKKGKVMTPEEKKKKDENLAKLREKLAAKIKVFKETRKAPGTKLPGAPKSREQILAERKRKEELKKAEKLKRKHEEIEDEDSDSDDSEDEEKSQGVLFGNIVFNDGSRVTSDLSKLRSTVEKSKQKGPANNDLKAHLLKLEQKKRKLEQMSPEEKKAFEEKEKWQRVMSQAEGVKLKDDEKLLRKAIKRKEKQKLKSEIEWKERKQIVKDTVAARAKRREENLKARRDNKGKKGKKQPRLKKFTGTINKAAKKRAGFEGSAKSKKK
ncbi:SURF6-domain-containing protein [Suhomyces tanzawaensis NRRL Y-17324]|uniref:SURF6-domain-containing protein n=1 Tax=Suhomyces tanzawaensis NRRL Y-17324 TaxID=984487 RepID=A0A1E4SNV8_9ASCO|nr:SURF6-domain-containing protein [Suhomyces tanzawaensis NRRL Y-17324]ODV81168.1 SURF6-domain-containing protein [Suhomyces tanzawaensis NRRL Y-17324]